MTTHAEWLEAQRFERAWWGTEWCLRWIGEQYKQIRYSQLMGMPADLDFGEKKIIDVGCGPVSMLLISRHGRSLGIEPMRLPKRVLLAYEQANVLIQRSQAEVAREHFPNFDEAWMYNVLQHVENVDHVLSALQHHAPVVRFFEWLHMPPCEGHPNTLHESMFEEAFAGWERETWTVGTLDEQLLRGDFIAATVRRVL